MSTPFDPYHQNRKLDAKIIVGLERIYEAFRVLLWKEAQSIGISPIQIQLLLFIQHHPPEQNTLSYLAQEFNLTKATLSESVKNLEKKELIQRELNPEDSRSRYLTLSEKGLDIIQESQQFTAVLEKSLQQMNPSQLQNFWDVLSHLLTDLHANETISLQRMCYSCKWLDSEAGSLHCKLLEIDLQRADIRIDCPEHESVS